MLIHQFVDESNDVRLGLPGLVRGLRWGQRFGSGRATLEADVQGDLLTSDQGHVFDEELHHALAVAIGFVTRAFDLLLAHDCHTNTAPTEEVGASAAWTRG